MDCRAAQARLISFHFGALHTDVRTLLEAHLQGCPCCLRAHLSVKGAIEEGQRAQGPARPGALVGHLGAALLGAALAILILVGLGLLHRPQAAPQLAAPGHLMVPLPRASCPAPTVPDEGTFI